MPGWQHAVMRRSPATQETRGAMGRMKRLPVLLMAVSSVIFAFCPAASAAPPIEFGITSATAFSVVDYIAQDKGFYAAEGVTVDTIVTTAAVALIQQLT